MNNCYCEQCSNDKIVGIQIEQYFNKLLIKNDKKIIELNIEEKEEEEEIDYNDFKVSTKQNNTLLDIIKYHLGIDKKVWKRGKGGKKIYGS